MVYFFAEVLVYFGHSKNNHKQLLNYSYMYMIAENQIIFSTSTYI